MRLDEFNEQALASRIERPAEAELTSENGRFDLGLGGLVR
jgi:hypothetical protein